MSIIISEEIRNIHYAKPLKAEDLKYYTEHFALAILQYCFDIYDKWLVSDAPDLQNEEGSEGIEVTELAISLNKAIIGDCLHYWETGDIRYKNKAENRGAHPGNEFYILPTIDSNDELAALEDIFRKKLKKLNTYKKRNINNLGIIIVMDGIPLTATSENWAEVIRVLQSDSSLKYDKAFFVYNSVLSYYNCKTDTTTNYNIDKNDFDALSKYARYTTEQKISHKE